MKTQAARRVGEAPPPPERIGATSKGPGKESESARGRRLTAALARDDEQVFSADNRLTYSIVALDGTGVAMEAARAAKAVVDDVMRKYAGPPQWSAPPANDDHAPHLPHLPQLPRLPRPAPRPRATCWLVGVCPQQWHLCRRPIPRSLDASTASAALRKSSRSSS